MASDKKNKDDKKDEKKDDAKSGNGEDVTVKDRGVRKARWGKFPGPGGSKVPLRVSMTKDAYAEITKHAAESLDAEICGILAGTLGEDDDGYFLEVEAAVRGEAARKGGTHVTFTHETWDAIHKTMEKEHPKLDIVGWYHSHPGFGVEFSEMDLFIQKNFFAANTQVAFVIDPLGGRSAMCLQTDNGVKYINKFWVDAREMQCQVPAGGGKSDAHSDADDEPRKGKAKTSVEKSLADMEKRLTQALQAIDDQRNWIYRTIMLFGMTIVVAILIGIGMFLYKTWSDPITPPKLRQTVNVPVMIDDKVMLIQVGVAGWQVPDELNAIWLQLERENRAKAEEAAKKAAAEAGAATQPAAQQSPAK